MKVFEKQVQERAVAEFHASSLQKNYRTIQDLVPHQAILAMIKADAYGHGAAWAARQLVGMSGLYGFGVATLEEGAEVRGALTAKMRRTSIIVLSGATPWSNEVGQYCEFYGLTPVITSEGSWAAFLKGGWPSRLPYELQFDTGMNRLGISLQNVRSVVKSCQALPPEQHPQGIFSHLAISESAVSRLTQLQLKKFKVLKSEFLSVVPGARFHLANSGGIWNHQAMDLEDLTDVVRPGIALYGVPPWLGASSRGLVPVMTFKVSVAAIHCLKPGDSIGYGGTFRVTGNDRVIAAILAAGYADGIHRSLGPQGRVWLDGKLTRFLGVVSMDLCAVQCRAETQVGAWAEILGPHTDPWVQAQAAGTIPYELFTSLTARIKRVYPEGL